MSRRNKKGNNIFSLIIVGLLSLLMAILLFTIYPALIIIPVVAVAIMILKRLRLRNEENLRYWEDMQREQTIGSLIAEFHERPHNFEQYIADLFSFYGFDAQVTPGSNDGGKDIIMYKDGYTYVVEVKLYGTYNKITREKIQKLHSAMWDCRADYAIFVTTSDFTSTAIEFAERNGIELINGNRLVSMLEERRQSFLNTSEY